MVRSWKQEFDQKYRKLLNSGDIKVIDAANDVLTKAIAGLDRVAKRAVAKTSRKGGLREKSKR